MPRKSRIDPLSQHFNVVSAKQLGYTACLQCGHITAINDKYCRVCHAPVHYRKIGGLSQPIAYLLASLLLFFPANLLPIMRTTSLGASQDDTILSGVLYLWQTGSYLIAAVVFIASFVTPIFKMLSIGYLCYTCHRQSTKRLLFRTKLYHFTELIGRWSMIDVFVVALMGALVKMGALATIEPRPGVLAFALVVFLTMLATEAFDPRLIWDRAEKNYLTPKA